MFIDTKKVFEYLEGKMKVFFQDSNKEQKQIHKTNLLCLLKWERAHPVVSAKTSKDFSEMRMHRYLGTLGGASLLSHLYPGPVTKPVSTK